MMTSRLFIFAIAAILLASAHEPAQAACQPTISEPCTPQPSADKSSDQPKPAGPKKTNQSAGPPAGGLRLTPDSGFGMDKAALARSAKSRAASRSRFEVRSPDTPNHR
jgi:hypothetical protein